MRIPMTFCCETAALTIRTGRKMQKRMIAERRDAQHAEHRALPPLDARTQDAVADERHREGRDDDDSDNRRARRRGEAKITLTEDLGPVIEEELKQRFEHGCPDSIPLRRRREIGLLTVAGGRFTVSSQISDTPSGATKATRHG